MTTLEEARARLAARGIKPILPAPDIPPQTNQPDYSAYTEFIPTNPRLSPQQNQFNIDTDAVLNGLDILGYYKLFCGKMTPQVGSRRESIMISCPTPGHADTHPSAWISLDKQTWFCGACQVGGDGLDIAAYNLNFPVPGYKTGKTYGELRTQILNRLGYQVYRPLGAKYDLLVPPGGDLPQATGALGPHLPAPGEQSPPGDSTGAATASGIIPLPPTVAAPPPAAPLPSIPPPPTTTPPPKH